MSESVSVGIDANWDSDEVFKIVNFNEKLKLRALIFEIQKMRKHQSGDTERSIGVIQGLDMVSELIEFNLKTEPYQVGSCIYSVENLSNEKGAL